MSPIMVEGMGTMGTDVHWRLYVDPQVLDNWTTAEVGSVLIHEAHHLIRSHAERAIEIGVGPPERLRFNVAADFEINDDLRELSLPEGGLDPQNYGFANGELAETYYILLEGHSPLPPVNCGAGAHGIRQEWERPELSGPMVDSLEGELIRQQVAIDVRSASQGIGIVPAGLERWARSFLQPKVDWRRELGSQVRSGIDVASGAVDYSYRRPSRRAGSPIGRDVLLPALIQPLPRVAVVVDTSGSMSEDALSRALAEISGILRSSGVSRSRLTVLACDTAVHSTQTVFTSSQVRLAGGGGTDMAVGIAQAAALRPRPDVIVVATDGFTPWGSPPVRLRVVVALIGDGPEPPSWARFVRVPLANALLG
jgi:predicted metal-dependent peptidase